LVAWEPDENGDEYQDSPSWEPEHGLPPAEVEIYTTRREVLTTRSCKGLDVRPLIAFVRHQLGGVLKALNRGELASMHSVPLDCMALAPIARAFMELVACPKALPRFTNQVSKVDRLAMPRLRVVHAADGSMQVTYKSMDDIAAFCSLQSTMGGNATGALRHNMGRASNQDMQVVAPPLLFTAKPDKKASGTFSVTMKFNTVFINGKYGTPRFPRALTGLIKKVKARDAVVKYVRKTIPRAHHLHTAGWTVLPITNYELTDEAAVPTE